MLIGVAIVIVAVGMGAMKHASVREPLQTFEWMKANRSPRDSAAFASAMYHAGYARREYDARWSATGYATIGVAVAVCGLVLVASGVTARRARDP
jgi:hypothetical protein